MEDKIEVGEYVRTKYGIAKVEKVELDKPHKTIWYTVDKAQLYCFLVREQEVIKSSKNIIDLIEEDDYVNGERVFATENRINDNGEKVILVENYNEWTDDGVIANKDIKTIVTHEQYKQIEYIVEE